MRIITHTCENCGTIVAGTLLEDERVVKCPGYQCTEIHTFEDLSEADQTYLLEQFEE